MIPETSKKTEFEKVKTDDFIVGVIEEVQYDKAHVFKGFQGAEDKVAVGVRFKFKLEGYKYLKTSRWMKLNLGEKSNLYKIMVCLVEGLEPEQRIDIDVVKGMKVKTLWAEKNDFQFLDKIRPVGAKVKAPLHPEEVPEINFDAPEMSGDPELNPENGLPF